MSVTFSTISHFVRQDLRGTVVLPLGHVHQLFAGALGYGSHAAYQVAVSNGREVEDFDGARHILPDDDLFMRRAIELGHGESSALIGASIMRVIGRELPEVKLHQSEEDLADEIRLSVEADISNSGEFSSAQAETNGGMAVFDLEFSSEEGVAEDAEEWGFDVSGSASLEHDEDRVYWGHELNVTSRVVFPKLGRRVLGDFTVKDVGASVLPWR
ncbi:hypothetical protein [Cupriavidus sp. TMH.W2]|uniref:hypothetical protein n=1 Tax=Cupriavidus sp. TMH.W2 TaxID=3434465 RepID=UPI003D787165